MVIALLSLDNSPFKLLMYTLSCLADSAQQANYGQHFAVCSVHCQYAVLIDCHDQLHRYLTVGNVSRMGIRWQL